MSTYATVADYTAYTSLAIQTPSNGLQSLVDSAENDIDKILPRGSYLTGAIIGISMDPSINGGNFKLQLTWRGVVYITPVILWNALGADLLLAMQNAVDQYGNLLPIASWDIPDPRYYQQQWAYGPLPNTPIVIQAVNDLSRQQLATPTVINSTLTGTNPIVTVQTIVGGGLRVNPYQIPANYSDALKTAVCAQAEYRDQMGPAFFVRAQYASVQGPEFRTQGKLPLIGPRVMRELSGTDLIQRGARARPGTATGRQVVYAPVGSTPLPDDWRMI